MPNNQANDPENTTSTPSPANQPRPRTRQRIYKPPPALNVPHIEEDAAERKRVLNVLAQRRYRQRKRESRLAASREEAEQGAESVLGDGGVHDAASEPMTAGESLEIAMTSPEDALDMEVPGVASIEHFEGLVDLGFPQEWASNDLLESPMSMALHDQEHFPSLFVGGVDMAFDPTLSADLSTQTGSSTQGSISPAELADTSSSLISTPDSFPDSYLLPVNELTLLRAFLRIATRLNAQSVWELTANSPFNLGTGPAADQLPVTWRPTTTQVLMPHHPVVDFLPWPGVRDRLIGLLSLPDEMRPEPARGSLALLNFTYDMEDGAEGMRIWGGDPYDEKSWEIGQAIFERWWFIFDRNVVEQSNHWRRLRGAPPLSMGNEDSGGPASGAGLGVVEL